MLVRQHVHDHTEWELLKWILLMALACVIALGVLSGVAGATDLKQVDGEPKLPQAELKDSQLGSWQTATQGLRVREDQQKTLEADVAFQVWQALELQHHQKYDDAIAAWHAIQLPSDTAIWKLVALSQGYLATGEIKSAAKVLGEANDSQSDNAVVHYFAGLLRLEQAYVAEEWHDTIETPRPRFVAFHPTDIAPNTKSMYQLSATMEFEEAVRLAPSVWADQPLVSTDWPTQAALVPTVGDLLLAVSANNFQAKAHNMLSYLYLERGLFETAERHMDSAAAGGLKVIGYPDLGEKYAAAGQHTDAARAFVKAMQHSSNKVKPAIQAWNNLRDAWHKLW